MSRRFRMGDRVLHADENDFHDCADSHSLFLVIFSMEGCHYCTDLIENVLTKIAKPAKELDFWVLLIDAQDAGDLIKKLNIEGYPAIYSMRDGQMFFYRGKRDLVSIVDFMKQLQKK